MGEIADIYRMTRKVPDLFWNTWVCRPVAAVVVRALKNTPITPNQVTLAAFVVALSSAAMIVALPGYFGLLAAVIVFELSYVLDCTDGMLARLRGTQSKSGHLLDFLMDELKAFLILGAVSVRLWMQHGDVRYLLAGLAGLIALASGISMTTFQRRPEIVAELEVPKPEGSPEAAEAAPPSLVKRVLGLGMGVLKFLVHYPSYILYAAAIGHIEVYFFPYLVVNALYAARSWLWVAVKFGRR